MKHSFESSKTNDLVFPVCQGLPSMDGDPSIEKMILRCRELRQWFPEHIPTIAERWELKREVEFIL